MPRIAGIVLALLWSAASVFAAATAPSATAPRAAAADFAADLKRAAATLEKAMPASGELMNAGDLAGANAKLLALFPEATRTPAEAFALGNVLFENDRQLSYALHKAAAEAEPDNPMVLWEWGMEQHRGGEYAAALATYRAFSKAKPEMAAAYALQADCLLRLDRVDEAADAWRKSEEAPDGSVEQMEDLVCAVHREPMPHARRAALLAKAVNGRDPDAAADLLALDCDFPLDWWNGGPARKYLAHDAPAVAAALALPADDVRARAMACAVECATARRRDAATLGAILTKHRLLTDADPTLPAHGGLLAAILAAALEAEAIDDATLRGRIGPAVLALARKGRDAELWNVALLAGPKDPEAGLQLEREAWRATGDARFAAGVLYLKLERGELAGGDADLAAALRQFPENGRVQRAAYEVAVREKKVTRALLAAAARAEFTRFTSFVAFATFVDRPRSDYLRGYFAQMRRLPATTAPAGGV